MSSLVRHGLALGLSASLAAGAAMGTPRGEASALPEVEIAPGVIEMPSILPDYSDVDPLRTIRMEVIEVRDQSQSSEDRAANTHASGERVYDALPGVMEAHTLGKIQLEISDVTVVELPEDMSTELCAPGIAREDWDQTLASIKTDASRQADLWQPGEYILDAQEEPDITLYQLTFEACNPYDRTESDDTPFEVGAWVDGDSDIVVFAEPEESLESHEIAHEDFGLGHAGMLECEPPVTSRTERCHLDEYGSDASIMGDGMGDLDRFSALELARAGLLDPSQIIDITEDGIYTLEAIHSEADGPKLFRIVVDDESWIGDAIANTPDEDLNPDLLGYTEVPEAFYIELSDSHTHTINEAGTWNDNNVGVRVFRGPRELENVDDIRAQTMQLNVGTGRDSTASTRGVIVNGADGTRVEVLSVDQRTGVDGTATIRVTHAA